MIIKKTFISPDNLHGLSHSQLIDKRDIYSSFFSELMVLIKRAKRKGQYKLAKHLQSTAELVKNSLNQIDDYLIK